MGALGRLLAAMGVLLLASPAAALTIRGDHDWVSSPDCPDGWTAPNYDDSAWEPAAYPWLLIWPAEWEPDAEARPFWDATGVGRACTRRTFDLASRPSGASTAYLYVDDDYTFWLNGVLVGQSHDEGAEKPGEKYDVSPFLQPGRNVIALEIIDTAYEKGAYFSLQIPGVPDQPPSTKARLRALLPWLQFAGILAAIAVALALLRAALRRLEPRVALWSPGLVGLATLVLAVACQFILLTQMLYSAPPEQPSAEWESATLAVVGAVFLALALLRDADRATDESGPLRGEGFWLLAIVALALFLRVWRIDSIPVGLYQDEATNGIDALFLLSPDEPWTLWNDSVGGRPTLFLYMLGWVLRTFGVSYLSLKILPVAFSVASVVAVWGVGRAAFGVRAGLWAAFFLAVSRWDIHYARMAWEVNCVPLFSAAGFALVLRGLQRPGHERSVVGGAMLLALGLYTYAAYRAVAAGAALFFLVVLLSRQREVLRRNWRVLLYAGLIATVVAAPLLIFSVIHPERYWERYRDVALTHYISFYGTPLPWLHQIGKGFLSLNHLGDDLIRHNLPRAPQIDAITGVFLLLGLAQAARESQRLGLRLLWSWFIAFLALASLTRDAPHATRYFGLVAPAALFAGFGAARLFARLGALVRIRALLWPLAAATAGALAALNAYQYFVVEAYHPNADFEMNLTARLICERVRREQDVNLYWTSDIAYWAGGPCYFLARGHGDTHELKPEDLAGGALASKIQQPALVFIGPELLAPNRNLVQRDEDDLPMLGMEKEPYIQRDRQGQLMYYVWDLTS